MKYHLLICMIFAAFQSVCSIADNHVWCMAVMQNGEKEPTFLQYAGIQDTIVNGIAYYTIYDDNIIVDYCSMRLPYGYKMADKKIYIYNYENHKEAIGFDFNLSVGDCFTTYNGMQWEIVSAKDTLVNVSVLGTGESVSKRLLSVRTLDGKTTDKWLEDFGSFNNHFMIKDLDNVEFSHTLWMEYEMGAYLAREISADPFYSHDSGWMKGDETDNEADEYESFRVSYKDDSLTLVNDLWVYGRRFYSCFYRKGDDIYRISCQQMEPFLSCNVDHKVDSFMFAGVPSPVSGYYTLHAGNDYSTGICSPKASRQHAPGLFDIHGRQLPFKPRHGVYIMNGVKYNAR